MSVHAHLSEVPLIGLSIVVSRWGTTTALELEGEWDLAAREAAEAAATRALARGPECLVLDLSRVSFIDVSGVRVVTELARRSMAERVHLAIVPGPRAVQRIRALPADHAPAFREATIATGGGAATRRIAEQR